MSVRHAGHPAAWPGEVAVVGWCTVCTREVAFELAPCPDGHGSDCPDRICVDCSAVLVLGVVDADAA